MFNYQMTLAILDLIAWRADLLIHICFQLLLGMLNGVAQSRAFKLRPIVSIDLKESGCTLTETKGKEGIVTYNLKWEE